jgi:hypothetical protein
MRSQKKAKQIGNIRDQRKYLENEILAGNYTAIDAMHGRVSPLKTVTISSHKVSTSPERQAAINQKAGEIENLKA